MLVYWLLISLVPPFAGYLLGRVPPSKLRLGLLVLFIAMPPLVFTAVMATADPAPEGFFLWWWIGMGLITVPEVIWITGALVGFSIGKRNVS
jgi:hypothetical protein